MKYEMRNMKYEMRNMKGILSIWLAMVGLVASSCQSYEELQVDPNRAVEVSPDLLLTNLETSVFNEISLSAALASRYMVYTDGSSVDQYYGWQRASFGPYANLRQVAKMEEEAMRLDRTNYLALAKFFRSYIIINLTQQFGDVPYSQAMSGFEGEYTPAYDRQQDIYAGVLQALEEANNELSEANGEITGDVVYGGDITKWKKFINSFKLRVLMSLSRKNDAALGIHEQFSRIVTQPDQYPIFTSNEDNAVLPFYDQDGNRYPFFNDNGIQTAYYLAEDFVGLLKERQDPRLLAVAAPDFNAQENGLPATSFEAYSGLGGSVSLSENINRLNEGEGSSIAARYYADPTNEPSVALSYAEVAFTLAEAAQRGWIFGDAATYYQAGITASMEFYGIAPEAIDAYLQQPNVVYDPENGLEMILTQKHLALFMQAGWQAFYDQRRTGIPDFSTEGDGILNNGQVPQRWMYPESELNLNGANVVEAVQRQYGGNDDINAKMWLLQE